MNRNQFDKEFNAKHGAKDKTATCGCCEKKFSTLRRQKDGDWYCAECDAWRWKGEFVKGKEHE